MDELDLTKILDGAGPEATPEVLGRIVARRRRQQARRYRVVATTALVVALAGAGIGVRLDQHAGTATAFAPRSSASSAPAGLKWVVQQGSQGGAPTAEVSGPGQFGFSSSTYLPGAPSPGPDYGAAVASSSAAANGAEVPSRCESKGCDVVFGSDVPRLLFTRHVGGLTVAVSLVTYDYPSTIAHGHVSATRPPTVSPPGASPTPIASSPPAGSSPLSGSSPPTASSPPGTATPLPAQPLPNIAPKSVIPVATTCPVESELVVNVSYGSVTRTLFVPTGGTSDHPFSVVASAGTSLGSAGSVVVAVARTSPSVASVSATFVGGRSDRMAPKDGWAVLAQRFPPGANLSRAGAVDIEATAASGRDLESVHLPATGSLATAPVLGICHILLVPVNVVSPPSEPPTRTSGASTGSSGSSGSVVGGMPSR
jgi:hypothetical protein